MRYKLLHRYLTRELKGLKNKRKDSRRLLISGSLVRVQVREFRKNRVRARFFRWWRVARKLGCSQACSQSAREVGKAAARAKGWVVCLVLFSCCATQLSQCSSEDGPATYCSSQRAMRRSGCCRPCRRSRSIPRPRNLLAGGHAEAVICRYRAMATRYCHSMDSKIERLPQASPAILGEHWDRSVYFQGKHQVRHY